MCFLVYPALQQLRAIILVVFEIISFQAYDSINSTTEHCMPKSNQMPAPTARVWNVPRLVRIGTIADVAGGGNGITQGSKNS